MIDDIEAWRRELLVVCAIVQDEDESVPQEEADRRYERYLELADAVEGTEGSAAVQALISSLRVTEDYGAHQAVFGALQRFPASVLAHGTAEAAPALVEIPSDKSGQVLQLLTLLASPTDLKAFNSAFGRLAPDLRARLSDLVLRHENEEWLADSRSSGLLRPEVLFER
jgi:hypothetical protein